MMKIANIRLSITLIFCLAFFLTQTGCATKRKILENTAKEWCETIRASQIIPVFPLTEDIQPGDVFLVQTTIDNQQREYKEKGFLPLNNHIARLDLTGYPDFYDHSFDTTGKSVFPIAWQRPVNVASWEPAPRAAFPTYSFSVSKGAGLDMAIPVSGVPVGLSLLGSHSANGSISIENARTLGIDILSAYNDLQVWAAEEQPRTFVKFYGCSNNDQNFGGKPTSECKKKNYLRMVTRIYVTGKLTIALSDASSVLGGADVGVPRPVDLILSQPSENLKNVNQATMTNYTNNLAALNAMLAESFKPSRVPVANEALAGVNKMLPGGSLRVTSASSHFIGLEQSFDPPLVIGYLGFDVEILEDGSLGVPIPTHAILEPIAGETPDTSLKAEPLSPKLIANQQVLDGLLKKKLKPNSSLDGKTFNEDQTREYADALAEKKGKTLKTIRRNGGKELAELIEQLRKTTTD